MLVNCKEQGKEPAFKRDKITTLQVNMGNLCNQNCIHCHMDASPQGKNIMPRKRVNDILKYLSENRGLTLDITGGAPELNPNFDYLVKSARHLVNEIIVRSNLTVIFEPGKENLPNFFKENRIHLICSLPCYTKENVDQQRGNGIFEKSLKALRILNELGYGKDDEMQLDLVHNPIGPNLPVQQDRLEMDYKRNLNKEYGIGFNRLITITNVPLGRFNDYLETNGAHEKYKKLLMNSFNAGVLGNLMCRAFLSVGWDGRLYDCDFNLALGLALKDANGRILTIDTISPVELEGKEIIFGEHCLACAAGSGSSCQGALDLSRPCVQGRGLLKLDTVRQNVKYFYQDAALKPKKELCCP
ncbi:MAG: arsenosugar biosynthesis radical SAM (seleno)protein ArsS, partial [Candidatus Omnitrophota bacterium]